MHTKKSIFVTALLLCVNTLFAQQTDILPPDLIVKPRPSKTANKTTGNASRLTSESYNYKIHYGGNRNHSFFYDYSGDNCWDDQLQDWKYDTWTASAPYNPEIRTIHSFDNAGRVAVKTHQIDKKPNGRANFKYQNGRLSEVESESFFNNTFVLTSKEKYTYNSKGQLIEKIVLNPADEVVEKETYVYSADGLSVKERSSLENGILTYKTREETNYDNGKKSEQISYTYNSGVWEPRSRYIYVAYIGDKPVLSYSISSDSIRHESHYNANGDMDTLTTYRIKNGVDTPYLRIVSIYNSHHQPTTKLVLSSGNGGATWDQGSNEEVTYKYDEFNLGVADKKDTDTKLKLYPVPANNALTISVNTKQQQPLSIAICHTDGRMVHSWAQPVDGTQYKETIDVSDIPAGAYIIRIGTGAGVVSKPFNILR